MQRNDFRIFRPSFSWQSSAIFKKLERPNNTELNRLSLLSTLRLFICTGPVSYAFSKKSLQIQWFLKMIRHHLRGPYKLVFRLLRGVLDHYNHLQINIKFTYISKRQLSDVSDVLRQLRHHLKFLVCQGLILLHMDVW